MKQQLTILAAVALAAFAPAKAQTIAPPPAPAAAPTAAPAAAPAPAPAISADELAALRAEYTQLQQREAQARATAQPVTAQTQAELDELTQKIAQLNKAAPTNQWQAETLRYFLGQLQANPPQLPANTPQGMTAAPSAVRLKTNTTIYDGPDPRNATAISTVAEPTIVLSIARHDAMHLIWTSQTGLAYALSQFVEVFQ